METIATILFYVCGLFVLGIQLSTLLDMWKQWGKDDDARKPQRNLYKEWTDELKAAGLTRYNSETRRWE